MIVLRKHRRIEQHPRARADAVGGDDRFGMIVGAVRARDGHVIAAVGNRLHVAIVFEHDGGVLAARGEERIEQIAAMHHHVRIRVALEKRLAEIEVGETLAGDHVHPHDAFRKYRTGVDVVEHAEFGEHARRVGRDLNAGADLTELRRAFDHVHRAAAPCETERCGKTTDAAADDEQRNPRRAHRAATGAAYGAALPERTGTRIEPSPSIEASIVSPVAIGATPSGVPVRRISPG
jgi:hypothetical protein